MSIIGDAIAPKTKQGAIDILQQQMERWNDLIAPCLPSYNHIDERIAFIRKVKTIYFDREREWYEKEVGGSFKEIESFEDEDGDSHQAAVDVSGLVQLCVFTLEPHVIHELHAAFKERVRFLKRDPLLMGEDYYPDIGPDTGTIPDTVVKMAAYDKRSSRR